MVKFEMCSAFIWKFLHVSGEVQCVQTILWNRSTSSTSGSWIIEKSSKLFKKKNKTKTKHKQAYSILTARYYVAYIHY